MERRAAFIPSPDLLMCSTVPVRIHSSARGTKVGIRRGPALMPYQMAIRNPDLMRLVSPYPGFIRKGYMQTSR